jgi:hypothetical protein
MKKTAIILIIIISLIIVISVATIYNVEDKIMKNELIKIAFDKLLFASIIAVFAFFLNFLLERFKSRLSFDNQLNSIRVQKISKVWAKLYEFDQCYETFQRRVSDQKNISDENSRYNALFNELHDVLIENRFWIGDEQYDEMNEYKRLTRDLINARNNNDINEIGEIEEKLKKLKKTIKEIRNKLINEV